MDWLELLLVTELELLDELDVLLAELKLLGLELMLTQELEL